MSCTNSELSSQFTEFKGTKWKMTATVSPNYSVSGPRTADRALPTTSYRLLFHGTGMNTNKSKQLGKIRISQNIASNVLQRKSNVITPETVADSRYTLITVCEWSKLNGPVGKAYSSVHKLYLTVSLTFSRQIQCTRKF